MSTQSSSPGTSSAVITWTTPVIVMLFVGIYINLPYFYNGGSWMKLVAVLCVIIYGVIFITNMLYQSSLCPNDSRDWGKIAIGALPSIAIIAIGSALVLYFSKFRIPIASLLKSYLVQPENQKNACCEDKMNLDKLESQSPRLKGFSYLYYLFFLVASSVIVGQSMSVVTCSARK
jgi:hypothetical protein